MLLRICGVIMQQLHGRHFSHAAAVWQTCLSCSSCMADILVMQQQLYGRHVCHAAAVWQKFSIQQLHGRYVCHAVAVWQTFSTQQHHGRQVCHAAAVWHTFLSCSSCMNDTLVMRQLQFSSLASSLDNDLR